MMLLSVTAVLAIIPDDSELCSHPIFLKMDSIPCARTHTFQCLPCCPKDTTWLHGVVVVMVVMVVVVVVVVAAAASSSSVLCWGQR